MAFQSGTPLFGNQPSSSGTSIFGQSSAAKPSIFGSTPQQPATFGGFGAQPQQQTQNQPSQGMSMFGGSNLGQQQQQPAQGSSLFGGFGQNQQNQQQPASGGLFAQSSTANQQKPNVSSFFATPPGGQTAPQQQSFTNPFAGFGQSQNQPQTQGAGSGMTTGFGGLGASTAANPLQSQQSMLGGFGASTMNPLFGRQPSQQPMTVVAATQSTGAAPPFTKSTRFNDLPDDVKRVFEQIDSHIQGRIQISKDLKDRKLGEEATKGQELIRNVHRDLLHMISILQSDVHQTKDIKAKVDQTVQDTIITTRIVDGFRNPQQSGAYLKSHANFPLEFFYRVTEEMRERLRWCKNAIEAIERKLASAMSQTQYTPQSISSTLEAQHSTFIALASKTASLDAELQKIKTLYTQLWRAKTGSMRDPFNDLDRANDGDFGLESLSGK